MAKHWSEEAAEVGRTQLTAREALHIWNTTPGDNPTDEQIKSQHGAQAFLLKKIDANRANARLSTGPRTPQGILRSSLNAQKHGLTGASRLLADEDAAHYEEHCNNYRSMWQPIGPEELMLVADLADTRWRILRIPRLEGALYAKGRMQFTEAMQDTDLALQADLVEIETHLYYEKPLRNLQLHENRLRRTLDKLEAKLTALQAVRKENEEADRQAQAELAKTEQAVAKAPASQPKSEANAKAGFVFTTAKITPVHAPSTEPKNHSSDKRDIQ